jgi:AraC-like DNA-binding protein
MKKARELLLLDPKESISKIAPAIGFRSSAYFSTFFKRHTGLTPQQYRQQLNEQKK